jgi:Protein of unknown function DUF262
MTDFDNEFDPNNWLAIEGTEAETETEIDANSIGKALPYDVKQNNITSQQITIYGLASRIKDNAVDLYPSFQRKDDLWAVVQKSRLIESLLLRIPIPAFYFDASDPDNWLVVDGLQRLSTLRHFIVNETNPLKLTGLEALHELEGKTFKELDITLRRRILETNITIFLIQSGTPKEIKYNIFKRINTGGLPLNNMEIRHALNQKGGAQYFFNEIYKKYYIIRFITENRIPQTRMEDRELFLRFVAFYLTPYTEYQPTLTDFLDKAMELLDNKTNEEVDTIVKDLGDSLFLYENVFNNLRFGKGTTRRAHLNSALFEVWTSELYKTHRNKIIMNISHIKSSFESALNAYSDEFRNSVSRNTASKYAVKTRFETIRNILKPFQ